MPTPVEEFTALVQGIRDGSKEAIEQLIASHSKYIYRVVRQRLAWEMRPLFDSADFVQSVWATALANRERLANCQNPYELINLLAKVASDRIIDERRRRLTSQARNIHRQVPLADAPEADSVPDPNPRPSQVMLAKDCQEQMLQDQRTQVRLLVLMKLQGATHDEIADLLGVNAKTVQRLLRRLEREVQR